MWVVIAIQIGATTIEQMNNFIDVHWLKLYEHIWNYYIVVISPILGYSVIYCLVRRYYQRLMCKNKGLLTNVEVKQIKITLAHTLLFFIAIMQWQICRYINNLIRNTDGMGETPFPRCFATALYYGSESLMVICLCQSINSAMSMIRKQ